MIFTGSDFRFDWDEDGCWMTVDCEGEEIRVHVLDPEQLYDRVKGAIGPWLREREDAEQRFNRAYAAEEEAREAYALSDPKHPDFHSVHADIWDAREGK